jgi:hypothetical protein
VPASIDVISRHFGSELVLDERGERMSFADAWRNPQMRLRASIAASNELIHQFREAVKAASEHGAPTTEAKIRMDHLVMISDLLVDALSEESGNWDEE